jgi:uncharacterized protein YjeT (DUF2065 family)
MSVKTTIEAVFCIVMPVLGLSYLLQPGQWIQFFRQLTQQPHGGLPIALAMLTAGTFGGYAYNDWTATWPIFISAFSWLLALEGAILLVFPTTLSALQKLPDSFLYLYVRGGGGVFIVLGILLCAHFFDFPKIG